MEQRWKKHRMLAVSLAGALARQPSGNSKERLPGKPGRS
jgi:hypothetical protein